MPILPLPATGHQWPVGNNDYRARPATTPQTVSYTPVAEPRGARPPPSLCPSEDAQDLWLESQPIAGTMAATYLESFNIPAPPDGWPTTAIRYHVGTRSMVLAGTTADGTIQAVQLMHLDPDGQPTRQTRGPLDGALVRLPGDPAGPLQMAAGPEAGVAAWCATGWETWIAFDLRHMSQVDLPSGRRVVICADDNNRHPTKGSSNTAATTLRRAVAKWRAGKYDVVAAYPWPERHKDGSGFQDLVKASGIAEARKRIELALNPAWVKVPRIPVEQARPRLTELVDSFVRRASTWSSPEEGDASTLPPVEAIRIDVGVGKSDAAHRRLVRLVTKWRAGGDRRNVAIAVPTHKLADEQAQRIMDLPEARAAGLVVRVWRGRSADDPKAPRQTMCRDVPAIELVRGVDLSPQSAVCCRRMPDSTVAKCPHFKICGYQRQRMAKADIWLVPHALLFTGKPDAVGELAALVVDESFWRAGLPPASDFPLDLLDRRDPVPDDPAATDRLVELRSLALDVLRKHDDGPALRKRFQDAGMTVAFAKEARELELRRRIDPGLRPGMTMTARKAATDLAAANRAMIRLAEFWCALQALLADGGPEKSGWIELVRAKTGARMVQTKRRRDVDKSWQVPTLLLDAVMQQELVRWYFPQAVVVADLAVEMPHQRVRQVNDRTYAKSMLQPLDEEQAKLRPEEARYRENRLEELRLLVVGEALRVAPRRVLVVAQKDVETELLKRFLRPNVVTAHHNAVAGRDEWRDVALLIVVGRTLPSPNKVAEMAEALSGIAVERMEGWYTRADATRETLRGAEPAEVNRHPDPLAEAIRWAICEGELVQIIGRARGVNRSAADPLDVLILCDVPVPLPVTETLPAVVLDPNLYARMLIKGGVMFRNSRHAHRAYPGMWPTKRAADKAFERAAMSATFPNNIWFMGECRTPLSCVNYRLSGAGNRSATAWFHAIVPDVAAWLAERLGKLAWCKVGS